MADHDIIKLLDELAPSVRAAFLASIADIKSEAQITAIIEALRRGDIAGAVQVMNLRAEMFAPLDDALRAAYLRGGADALSALPRLPDPFPVVAWLLASMAETHARKHGCATSLLVSSARSRAINGS